MNQVKKILPKAGKMFLLMTILCGVLYTAVVTVAAQAIFPKQANGSIIEIDGVKYGSELLGQYYTKDTHMWGRIMNIDTSTFTDEEGNALLYAAPSNLSPASDEYQALIDERVKMIKEANPDAKKEQIPVDLVTCSGSGLDPHISIAAANYQVPRIAKANGMEEAEVEKMIEQSTTKPFLGVFGQPVVNVLEFNLRLDGILTEN